MFEPGPPGRHPAVILLHGADGLKAHGASYEASARHLAGHGYLVLLPHYFAPERVGPTAPP